MSSTEKDKGQLLKSQRISSRQWMANNFYSQFESVFKSYKCERDAVKDPNKPDEDDPTKTSIGMPDTYALINRQVARITAQQPNLRFRADDMSLAMKISRRRTAGAKKARPPGCDVRLVRSRVELGLP
jgi:hypothetical protein